MSKSSTPTFILTARSALRLTQSEFAAAIGRSQATVSRMERDPRFVTIADIAAIRRLIREQRLLLDDAEDIVLSVTA